jgi:hypothetical protein
LYIFKLTVAIVFLSLTNNFLISQYLNFNTGNLRIESTSGASRKTLFFVGAGIYKIFPLTDGRRGELSYVISSTATFRPNKFIFLSTGMDIFKPQYQKGIVLDVNFIPSLGLDEDNIHVIFGAGGMTLIGEGGIGFEFIASMKFNYFFSKDHAASLEVKSPLHYDTRALVLFTAGISFAF